MSYLRFIPNLIVMAPKDENELRDMLWTATRYDKGPVAIRYPRGESLGLELNKDYTEIPIGISEVLREGQDIAILAVGDRVQSAVLLGKALEQKGISARVINARFIKPLDEKMLSRVAAKYPLVITLENNSVMGGFGSGVSEYISQLDDMNVTVKRFGLPDAFVPHGSIRDLMNHVQLDIDSLMNNIVKFVKKIKKSG